AHTVKPFAAGPQVHLAARQRPAGGSPPVSKRLTVGRGLEDQVARGVELAFEGDLAISSGSASHATAPRYSTGCSAVSAAASTTCEPLRTSRRSTNVIAASASATIALVVADNCSPWTNAEPAALSSASPNWSGSWLATASAPPRVSLAVCAACAGTPAGSVTASCARYTAVPRLPR